MLGVAANAKRPLYLGTTRHLHPAIGKCPPPEFSLHPGLRFFDPVTIGARLPHPLGQCRSIKSVDMTICAIGPSLLAPSDVNEMELLFSGELHK